MKFKEELSKLGLTEEQVKSVGTLIDGQFVPKGTFNEINEENKTLKASVAERDKQLDELKKASGDNADLQAQITELQRINNEQQKAHDAEMKQLKFDNAVDAALTAAGAKNSKALKALLDLGKISLDDNGKLLGFNEQIKNLQKSDGYLFAEKTNEQQQNFTGFQPGASGEVKPGANVKPSEMTYSQLAAYMEANPGAKID